MMAFDILVPQHVHAVCQCP